MTEIVTGSLPVRVTQFGTLVLTQFPNKDAAAAFAQGLADAKLAQENPAEFRRRYALKHGMDETGVPSDG